jgi:hypothetical protein
MKKNIASASPLPSVSALRDFADYTRKEEALSEYWFIHDPTPLKQHKPTYGWAGGRSALDKLLPEGNLAFVSWESIVSATWEQLTGAEPIEGYLPGLSDRSMARAVTLGEECLNYLDTKRRDSEGQLVSYQKNDWLLGLALQEVESDSREATQVPGCLREGAINKVGDNCLSLENNFTGEALVHHVHDSNGEKRAVVIGLVLGRGGLDSLPYIDGDGPVVFNFAATVEEPRAMAQLELFAVQFETYFKAMVVPFIGMPSITWKLVNHKWMSLPEWGQLDLDDLALDDQIRKPEQEEYSRVSEEFIELAVNAGGPIPSR